MSGPHTGPNQGRESVKTRYVSGNLVFARGKSGQSIHFGEDGGSSNLDIKFFGATSGAFMLWDESADTLQFDKVDVLFGDTDFLKFGDASDMAMNWDGSIFEILPLTDDVGAVNIGDGTTDCDFKWFGGAAGDAVRFDVGNKALVIDGDVRLDLSECTVAAANTDGGVIRAGTSGAYIVEDTADMKFMSFYFDNGATSGDSRGMYLRLNVTGIGGGGEAARIFTEIVDVAANTVRGAHISLSFNASGSVTGLGTALETTLHIPSGGGLAGTVSSIKAAINADAAGSDPAGSQISVFNVVAQGTQAGIDDLDDDVVLFHFQGWAADTGSMVYDNTAAVPANADGSIKIRLPSGDLAYLRYFNAQA